MSLLEGLTTWDAYQVEEMLPRHGYVALNNNTIFIFQDQQGRYGMVLFELNKDEVEAIRTTLKIMRR